MGNLPSGGVSAKRWAVLRYQLERQDAATNRGSPPGNLGHPGETCCEDYQVQEHIAARAIARVPESTHAPTNSLNKQLLREQEQLSAPQLTMWSTPRFDAKGDVARVSRDATTSGQRGVHMSSRGIGTPPGKGWRQAWPCPRPKASARSDPWEEECSSWHLSNSDGCLPGSIAQVTRSVTGVSPIDPASSDQGGSAQN